jgi:predicted neutral ceramidase superfamily lipid hydrolase
MIIEKEKTVYLKFMILLIARIFQKELCLIKSKRKPNSSFSFVEELIAYAVFSFTTLILWQ